MDEIRKFKESDLLDIYAIYCFYVENSLAIFDIVPESFIVFSRSMKEIVSKYPFYVAVHDGKLIGYGFVHSAFSKAAYRYCVELTIYFKDQAHYGLPKQLYECIEKDCIYLGMRWVISCITDSNYASLRFHQRLGFKQYGALPECGLKDGAWLGVVWLCKRIGV